MYRFAIAMALARGCGSPTPPVLLLDDVFDKSDQRYDMIQAILSYSTYSCLPPRVPSYVSSCMLVRGTGLLRRMQNVE